MQEMAFSVALHIILRRVI